MSTMTTINNCDCAEGKMDHYDKDGKLIAENVPIGLHVHDCEYIKARNDLIDEAYRDAHEDDRLFFNRMNELARKRRVVK